jgi:hypothetical protein
MDPKQSLNYRRTRGALQAPRCQHVWLNGQRCAAPALSGQTRCHFHQHIEPCSLDSQAAEPHLPFIEDATSLQVVLNRVIRCINSGPSTYKTWGLMLYALQIACTNLNNFMAEHPREDTEPAQPHQRPQPQIVSAQRKHKVNGKDNDERSLSELLLAMLAKGGNGDTDALPRCLRSRDDHDAVIEERQGPSQALPGDRTEGVARGS